MGGTALVSGGTGGLGAAVTATLLDRGWRVVVPWESEHELSRLPSGADGLVLVQADLTDAAAVRRCAEQAAADPDRPVRAVVNLVGGFAMGGRVHETPVDDFEQMLRLNLRPSYLVCQATLPHLVGAGGGAVVLVSSQSTRKPFSGAAGYLTAKTAVLGLAGALHAEYGKEGVRVNTILPGVIDTPGNRASMPDADRKGWTAPADIADTIAYLCSDASRAVRNSQIDV
ncbi:3-oxoacyl-(ACP) reductase [Catellatospora methionotrophica]|uniref:3-oxoacyl-(ACP) reductase n=1 Tax=Catellatospora methionotrophica TaxID=121620 RepID=A0A8J3PKB3_9ACTN|nr:SDR family NAD(P)-dependent oxidoreductase [Catellatospora methionotrophica]GIG18296.1 3-oxoacyl-(ACP) reductase [Catellatospora methionotrophica]